MNTERVLAMALALLVPAAAAAAPPADPWSMAVGVGLPAFTSGSAKDQRELPTFLALSVPFRHAGLRFEPELAVGGNRSFAPYDLAPAGATPLPALVGAVPVASRWYRAGAVVAVERAVAERATLHAGPWVAAIYRDEAVDSEVARWSGTFLDWQFGASGGGELALSSTVSVGAALRVAATTLEDSGSGGFERGEDGLSRVSSDGNTFLSGEAMFSVRVAL